METLIQVSRFVILAGSLTFLVACSQPYGMKATAPASTTQTPAEPVADDEDAEKVDATDVDPADQALADTSGDHPDEVATDVASARQNGKSPGTNGESALPQPTRTQKESSGKNAADSGSSPNDKVSAPSNDAKSNAGSHSLKRNSSTGDNDSDGSSKTQDKSNRPQPVSPEAVAEYDAHRDIRSSLHKNYKNLPIENDSRRRDILFVIDNSGSMNYEQTQLAARFKNFIAMLGDLDWQIAITTTDMMNDNNRSQGRLVPLRTLGKKMPKDFHAHIIRPSYGENIATELFKNTIRRKPNEGTGFEQGLASTAKAFSRLREKNAPIRSLIRKNSQVHVVLITDSDETPFSLRGVMHRGLTPTTFKAAIDASLGRNLVFHALIVRPGDGECRYNEKYNNEAEGIAYEKVAKDTGGIIGSVCSPDYTSELRDIAKVVSSASYVLDCPVVQDSRYPLEVVDNFNQSVQVTSVQGARIEVQGINPQATSLNVVYWCQ